MLNFKPMKMKKKIIRVAGIFVIAATLSSCATVFGGAVSQCQRTQPAAGQPARELRAGALIADVILFWPGAIIDFATGAIYKPCN
jgi:hypothetical protein